MSLYRPASCLDITEFYGQVEKALGFSKRPQKGEEQSEADVQVFPIVINSTLDPYCCPAVSTKIGLAYDNYRKKERESLENPFARIIREKQDAQGQDVNNDPSDVMCYAVRLADTRGKFDLQKAKALGVPPGPSFGIVCISHFPFSSSLNPFFFCLSRKTDQRGDHHHACMKVGQAFRLHRRADTRRLYLDCDLPD